MNARETLAAAADWLGWQDEDLSFGLHNAKDAIKLYEYAMAHPELNEMADTWTAGQLRKAVGYDPMTGPGYDDGKKIAEAA